MRHNTSESLYFLIRNSDSPVALETIPQYRTIDLATKLRRVRELPQGSEICAITLKSTTAHGQGPQKILGIYPRRILFDYKNKRHLEETAAYFTYAYLSRNGDDLSDTRNSRGCLTNLMKSSAVPEKVITLVRSQMDHYLSLDPSAKKTYFEKLQKKSSWAYANLPEPIA